MGPFLTVVRFRGLEMVFQKSFKAIIMSAFKNNLLIPIHSGKTGSQIKTVVLLY